MNTLTNTLDAVLEAWLNAFRGVVEMYQPGGEVESAFNSPQDWILPLSVVKKL